jgi:hypothetical protein
MTPEQKMQAVVEAAGECWHHLLPVTVVAQCAKCNNYKPNPSPTDLNELFRLAEKLGFMSVLLDSGMFDASTLCQIVRYRDLNIDLQVEVPGDTPSEALLNALYEAVS